MRLSRRAIAGMILLALLIAVVVITQRRGEDSTAADRIDGAPPPMEEMDAAQGIETATPVGSRNRAATYAAMRRELSKDSSDATCVQVIGDAANFAASERASAAPRDTESHNDWMLAELGKLQRNAASVADPEMLLASLLQLPFPDRQDPDAAIQSMLLDFGTRAASSGSPVLAWHALRACAEAGQSCRFAHLEQDLLDMQRDNAEAWALVATLRHERGDFSGALAAMRGAANASTATWHWPETIALVERTLATHTPIPYPDTAGVALGAAAAATPPARIDRICRAESASNRAWGEACLAFGELRQEHHESQMGQALAYPIRRQALIALGEAERAVEVQSAQERSSAENMAGGQDLMVASARLQLALVDTDRAKLHAWLGSVRELGEVPGRREFLRREVPALLERAGLLGREGARECMAELFLEPRAVGDTRRALLEHRLQPGDELHMSLRDNRTGTRSGTTFTRRIGPDGKIPLPRGLSIAAAGMTTEQFQRELAAAISGNQPADALVIPISRRPREELRQEFDNASRP